MIFKCYITEYSRGYNERLSLQKSMKLGWDCWPQHLDADTLKEFYAFFKQLHQSLGKEVELKIEVIKR